MSFSHSTIGESTASIRYTYNIYVGMMVVYMCNILKWLDAL